jgi:hypothetical protein
MRSVKGLLICLFFVVFCLVLAGQALADKETGSGTFFDTIVNKNAQGTKYTGTLTIYYQPSGTGSCGDFAPNTNMYYFFRIKKGFKVYPFSGITQDICYLNQSEQATAIDSFISQNVMPFLSSNSNATYALKSVTQVVEDDETFFAGCCSDLFFMVMDIEIAVKE